MPSTSNNRQWRSRFPTHPRREVSIEGENSDLQPSQIRYVAITKDMQPISSENFRQLAHENISDEYDLIPVVDKRLNGSVDVDARRVPCLTDHRFPPVETGYATASEFSDQWQSGYVQLCQPVHDNECVERSAAFETNGYSRKATSEQWLPVDSAHMRPTTETHTPNHYITHVSPHNRIAIQQTADWRLSEIQTPPMAVSKRDQPIYNPVRYPLSYRSIAAAHGQINQQRIPQWSINRRPHFHRREISPETSGGNAADYEFSNQFDNGQYETAYNYQQYPRSLTDEYENFDIDYGQRLSEESMPVFKQRQIQSTISPYAPSQLRPEKLTQKGINIPLTFPPVVLNLVATYQMGSEKYIEPSMLNQESDLIGTGLVNQMHETPQPNVDLRSSNFPPDLGQECYVYEKSAEPIIPGSEIFNYEKSTDPQQKDITPQPPLRTSLLPNGLTETFYRKRKYQKPKGPPPPYPRPPIVPRDQTEKSKSVLPSLLEPEELSGVIHMLPGGKNPKRPQPPPLPRPTRRPFPPQPQPKFPSLPPSPKTQTPPSSPGENPNKSESPHRSFVEPLYPAQSEKENPLPMLTEIRTGYPRKARPTIILPAPDRPPTQPPPPPPPMPHDRPSMPRDRPSTPPRRLPAPRAPRPLPDPRNYDVSAILCQVEPFASQSIGSS